MKKPKEIDVLNRMVWFEDTPEIVEDMKAQGFPEWSRHLHKMNICGILMRSQLKTSLMKWGMIWLIIPILKI